MDTDGQGGKTARRREEVERWFIRRGVPHFGRYRSQTLVPFLPIVLLVFCVEVAAMPWFDLDKVVAAVSPGQENGLLRPLAAALVVLALLCAT
jgi:hypothetical protein